MKPSFIIIGAQKAGTSALFNMLAKHPQVLPPTRKEIHYFDVEGTYAKGLPHYLDHFPPRPLRPGKWITLEASPSYLFHAARCAPRIAEALPKAICVAILRDPVRRAYSAWNMFRDFKHQPKWAHLHDPRSFEQAVEDELAGRTDHQRHQYLARGHYAEQLEHFLAWIPKGQLLIRAYPDLKQAPHAFVNDLYSRVGLAPLPEASSVSRVTANKRPYPNSLDTGLAQELYQYFAPEMVKLRQLLGYDLNLMEDHG